MRCPGFGVNSHVHFFARQLVHAIKSLFMRMNRLSMACTDCLANKYCFI